MKNLLKKLLIIFVVVYSISISYGLYAELLDSSSCDGRTNSQLNNESEMKNVIDTVTNIAKKAVSRKTKITNSVDSLSN